MELIDIPHLTNRANALAKSKDVLSTSMKKGDVYARMILVNYLFKNHFTNTKQTSNFA